MIPPNYNRTHHSSITSKNHLATPTHYITTMNLSARLYLLDTISQLHATSRCSHVPAADPNASGSSSKESARSDSRAPCGDLFIPQLLHTIYTQRFVPFQPITCSYQFTAFFTCSCYIVQFDSNLTPSNSSFLSKRVFLYVHDVQHS